MSMVEVRYSGGGVHCEDIINSPTELVRVS